MGRLSRLREAGVRAGYGVATGNPKTNPLMMRYIKDTPGIRTVGFSDRSYHLDKFGTLRRLKVKV